MPEGFNSVADLVVKVKAETKDFQGGLADVVNAVKGFDGMMGGSLKGLVDFGVKGQASIGGIIGTLTELGGKVTKISEVLSLAGDVAGQVAKMAGAGDEFSKIEGEAAGVQQVLTALAQQGLADVKDEAQQAAAALGLYAMNAEGAETSSENFAQRGLSRLSEAVRQVKLDLAGLATPGSLDIDTEGQLLDRTNAKIAELKARLAEADANAAAAGASGIADPAGEAERQLAALEKQAWVLGQLQGMERVPWTATVNTEKQDEYLKKLADEVALIEKKASLIGATAAISAAELTRERLRLDADRNKVGFSDDKEAEIGAYVERIRSAQSRLDAAAEGKQKRELGERQDVAAGRVIDDVVRSIDAEARYRREIGMSVGEVAALRTEEAALARIRGTGREATQTEILMIRAAAQAKGREVEANDKLKRSQSELAAASQVMSRTLESAFSGWMSGAKMKWDDLVGGMLKDIAMLVLRQSVLQPLFGGGGGGSGGGAGLIGTIASSIFGGFRENGGPVEAGKAYIVGEKRPELFIPNTSGRIEPRVGGGASGEVVVTVKASPELYAEIDNRAEGVVTKRQPQIVGAAVKTTKGALPGMLSDAQKRSL